MMYTAFRNGMQDTRLTTSGGFTPPGCGRTITDDNGGCEACGNIGIDPAYQHSSNIYFSYLGTQLAGKRFKRPRSCSAWALMTVSATRARDAASRRFGTPAATRFKNAIAPTESWLKAGPHSTRCELMYEGTARDMRPR